MNSEPQLKLGDIKKPNKNPNDDILFLTNLSDQRQAVDTLVSESRADSDYYFYLIASGLIATLGLLNDNPVVVIGAMLIAPALFPILSLGLAIVTRSKQATFRALKAISVSFVMVVIASTILAFLFQSMLGDELNQTIALASSPNATSWLIAALSGLIASYAWVKQSQSAMLPGVAIAVSLVPPLANIGVGIVATNSIVFTGSLLTFIINLIMITAASVVIFAVFGFSDMRNWQSLRLRQEVKELEKGKEKIDTTIIKIASDLKAADKNPVKKGLKNSSDQLKSTFDDKS